MSKATETQKPLGLELDIMLYAQDVSIAQAAHIEAIAELLKLAGEEEAIAIAAAALTSAVEVKIAPSNLEKFSIAHHIHWLHLKGLDRNQKTAIAKWILDNISEQVSQ